MASRQPPVACAPPISSSSNAPGVVCFCPPDSSRWCRSRIAARERRRGRRGRRSRRSRPATSRYQLRHASARDGNDALAIDPVPILEPAQKRNPVEDLEANLRQPGTGDDRLTAARDRGDLALDPPLRAKRGGLLAQTARPSRQPDRRASAPPRRGATPSRRGCVTAASGSGCRRRSSPAVDWPR